MACTDLRRGTIVDGGGQGCSKLFKSAGNGCGLFVNNKNDEYNDRRVQKV